MLPWAVIIIMYNVFIGNHDHVEEHWRQEKEVLTIAHESEASALSFWRKHSHIVAYI